jgi:voltage-gated potassium channel
MNYRNKIKNPHIHWGLVFCILSLFSIIVAGAVGYHLIEHWTLIEGLYMTIITVSTVGYGELHPLSDAGRIFTVILIAFGVGAVTFSISVIFRIIFQHQLKIFMEKRSMQREINSISKHIIVCGYGRMGRKTATALIRAGRSVVVIESVAALAEEIERDGIPVVTGEAAEEETLQRAGIDRAVSLVATLGSDADNLFLTLTARGMNPDIDIIVRAGDDRNCRKFTQAGASRVVSPLDAGTNRIIRLITRPDIVDFVELIAEGDDIKFEVSKITLDDSSKFVGKTLAEGRVRQEVGGMVMAIQRSTGQTLFDPSPDLCLESGDSLFVVGATGKNA